jgi:hypothetical protein
VEKAKIIGFYGMIFADFVDIIMFKAIFCMQGCKNGQGGKAKTRSVAIAARPDVSAGWDWRQ